MISFSQIIFNYQLKKKLLTHNHKKANQIKLKVFNI